MSGRGPGRITFTVLAAGTILLGLWVHRGGASLGAVPRDVLGDALWATMMAWLVGAAAPQQPVLVRGAAAFAICCAVEFSQLVHTPLLDQVRGSTLGHLVLGSGFDPRDLAAYGAGVTLAVLIEWRMQRRADAGRGSGA